MFRKLIIIVILSVTFLNIFPCNTYAELSYQAPEIKAVSAMLIDARRGQILFKKNSDQHLHISNASKIMAALIAVENINLDSKVTISRDAASARGSVLNLKAGGKYNATDLISAIILTSANDAAIALAEFTSGDVKKFVDAMNNKAIELHMTDTKFINPTGLYDSQQYTTAEDLSLLIQYALKKPKFNKIFSTKGQVLDSQILTNNNKLFWSYAGVDGGKAGYNEEDKQSAITAATRENQRLIAIILDSSQESIWQDSAALLDFGFNNFRTGILVNKDQVLKTITVGGKEIGLISGQDIYYVYPVGSSYVKRIEFNLLKDFELPILKSTNLGTVTYILDDGTNINIQLYPNAEIRLPQTIISNMIDVLKDVKDLAVILIILLLVELIIGINKISRFVKRKGKK